MTKARLISKKACASLIKITKSKVMVIISDGIYFQLAIKCLTL